MTRRFAVTTHRDGAGVVRLVVSGEVDHDTSDALRAVIEEAVEDGAADGGVDEVLVDLARVTFMDAAGIRALLAGHDTARRRGAAYRVADPQPIVRHVFLITGLLGVLDVVTRPVDARTISDDPR